MKKSIPARKLILRTERIRVLALTQLRVLAGGSETTTGTTHSHDAPHFPSDTADSAQTPPPPTGCAG